MAKKEAEKKKAEEARLAAEKKAAQEKALKQQENNKLLDKFGTLMDQFSVTLNKKHFQSAIEVRDKIKALGFEEPKVNVHASEIYKKSFTFPQIAHNDYAVEQFETLSVAEQNLNNDPSNEALMETFSKTCDEVAMNLKERYKEQWVDPKDDRASDLVA